MDTNQVYQDITICVQTILPTVLVPIVTKYCLHPIGKRLYNVESCYIGYIYNLQWCENGLLYEIHYLRDIDWEDCCSSFTKEDIEMCPLKINRCSLEEQYIKYDFWLSMPASGCVAIVHNSFKICARCGREICNLCFTRSRELLRTLGDLNTKFADNRETTLPYIKNLLGYYSHDKCFFGHVRICIYCQPSFPIEQYDALKNIWRSAMSDIKKS